MFACLLFKSREFKVYYYFVKSEDSLTGLYRPDECNKWICRNSVYLALFELFCLLGLDQKPLTPWVIRETTVYAIRNTRALYVALRINASSKDHALLAGLVSKAGALFTEVNAGISLNLRWRRFKWQDTGLGQGWQRLRLPDDHLSSGPCIAATTLQWNRVKSMGNGCIWGVRPVRGNPWVPQISWRAVGWKTPVKMSLKRGTVLSKENKVKSMQKRSVTQCGAR